MDIKPRGTIKIKGAFRGRRLIDAKMEQKYGIGGVDIEEEQGDNPVREQVERGGIFMRVPILQRGQGEHFIVMVYC